MDKIKSWRHRRIWIKPEYLDLLKGLDGISLREREYVDEWINSGKPLVGRAINPCDQSDEDLVPLGLMLHLSNMQKKRLNIQVELAAVLKVEEPLDLLKVLEVLPTSMAVKVRNMLTLLSEYPIQVKVFGSAFWSYEGQKNYMTEYSDIDLLILPSHNCDLFKLAETLCELSDSIGIRLDGEFEFQKGYSVSWREFAGNAGELLMKTDIGPKMMARNQMIEEFTDPHR